MLFSFWNIVIELLIGLSTLLGYLLAYSSQAAQAAATVPPTELNVLFTC